MSIEIILLILLAAILKEATTEACNEADSRDMEQWCHALHRMLSLSPAGRTALDAGGLLADCQAPLMAADAGLPQRNSENGRSPAAGAASVQRRAGPSGRRKRRQVRWSKRLLAGGNVCDLHDSRCLLLHQPVEVVASGQPDSHTVTRTWVLRALGVVLGLVQQKLEPDAAPCATLQLLKAAPATVTLLSPMLGDCMPRRSTGRGVRAMMDVLSAFFSLHYTALQRPAVALLVLGGSGRSCRARAVRRVSVVLHSLVQSVTRAAYHAGEAHCSAPVERKH